MRFSVTIFDFCSIQTMQFSRILGRRYGTITNLEYFAMHIAYKGCMMTEKIVALGFDMCELAVLGMISQESSIVTMADCCTLPETQESIFLFIINIGSSGIDYETARATILGSSSYKGIPKLLIIDDYTQEASIDCEAIADIDYYRRPILTDSLKLRIRFHRERMQLRRKCLAYETPARLFNAIFPQSPVDIYISKNGEEITEGAFAPYSISPMVETILQRKREEIHTLGWSQFTHPQDLPLDLNNLSKLESGEIDGYTMDKRYLRPDGSSIWTNIIVAPILLTEEDITLQLCLISDISQRKKLEEELAQNERSKDILLRHLPGMAYRCLYDRSWTMEYVSEGCHALTGFLPEEIVQNRSIPYADIIAPEYRERIQSAWDDAIQGKRIFKDEYEIIASNGQLKWVLETGQGVFDESGTIESLQGIILDITEKETYEKQLLHIHEYDQNTGLPNQRALERLLDQERVTDQKSGRALVCVNISTVNSISMTYGFAQGQKVICKIAAELKMLQDADHILFNTHEYRFTYYVRNCHQSEETTSFVQKISQQLHPLLAIERIGWGIGVLELEGYAQHDSDTLFRNVLVASEKSLAGFEQDSGYCFFNKKLELEIEREHILLKELNEIASGIDEGRLYLEFQPILDLKTNRVTGFEALSRLKSNRLGVVPPLEFIPLLEKTKLIIALGECIISKSLNFQKALREAGHDHIMISINVSPIQLLKKEFVANLMHLVEATQTNPALICLEITESIFESNTQEINRLLRLLRQTGFHIALDDFGTGFSSFARERELQVDCIKIDQSFISRLQHLREEETVTGDIISMAHKQGHYVVAEGVETETQKHYLLTHGCDKIQGYLIGRPHSQNEALALLERQTE